MAETTTQWASRITGYGEMNPHEIKLHPLNMRVHPDSQVAALRSMMATLGLIQNVLVNKTTGYLLDGHARVELAREQAQLFIPVTFVELTPEEELAALALYDRLGALAELHEERARTLLSQVVIEDECLQQALFDIVKPLKSAGPTAAAAPHADAAVTGNVQQVRMIQLFYDALEYNDVMKEYAALREAGGGENLSVVFREVLHRAYLSLSPAP